MNIQHEKFVDLDCSVVDVDISTEGQVAILYGDDLLRAATIDGRELTLESGLIPNRIRIIDQDHFFVIGRWDDETYASIVDGHGRRTWGWPIDGNIRDICVADGWVGIGYSEYSQLGVLALRLFGRSMIYYDDVFGRTAVDTFDCYCICTGENASIYFSAYTGFPLVHWDFSTMSQRVYEAPATFRSSHAISVRNGDCFFFGPYKHQRSFYKWNLESGLITKVGQLPDDFGAPKKRPNIRGLSGGRFLVVEPDSYSIFSF